MPSMIIYDSERDIKHLIENNTTTSVVSAVYMENSVDTEKLVQKCTGEACSCNDVRSMASKQSSDDVMPISSILVSDTWNANNDIFTAEELVAARETPQYKPINWMHRGSEETKNETIGVMVSVSLVKGGLDSLKYFTDSDVSDYTQASIGNTLSSKVHIRQDGLIWSQYFPSYAKKVEKGIEKGNLYVSMECFFDDFDYALKDKDGGIEIVSRDNASASLSKHLKQYGGSGSTNFKGKNVKIGRVLRKIIFSGQGIVKEPANVDGDDRILSIILKDDTLLSAQSQTNSPSSSPLALDTENGPAAPTAPGAPGVPEQGPTTDPRILPSTYIDPEQYLFNTPQEARDVAENELGCTGYHVYLPDRHSDTPYLIADLLGDPDDIEKQFRRPRYLPCSNHAEYLLLLDKEGEVGDSGGGSSQRGCPEDTNVCLTLSEDGSIHYQTDSDISRFVIQHDGCVGGASGGATESLGWDVTVSGASVYAASGPNASNIKAGAGHLISLSGAETSEVAGVPKNCLSTMYFYDGDNNKLIVKWSGGATVPTNDGSNPGSGNTGSGSPGGFQSPKFITHKQPATSIYQYGNGVAMSEESFEVLKGTLRKKIETNRKNGYIKEENPKVEYMSETKIDFEQKYNAVAEELAELRAEISSHEMAECNTKIEELESTLSEASLVIDDATDQLNTIPGLLDELNTLRGFASEADKVIGDLEKWQLGKDRLSEMTSLAGDVYSDHDVESLSSMSSTAFKTLKLSVNKIIDKIEASVPKVPEVPEPSAEEMEATKMANLIHSLENTTTDTSPDLLVRASRQVDDPLTTARSLVNRALKR